MKDSWGMLVAVLLAVLLLCSFMPVAAEESGRDEVAAALSKLADPVVTVRHDALEALRDHTDDPRIVPFLIRALSDQDAEVRLLAVEVLGNTRAPRAVAPLVPLLRDGDRDICAAAIEALGRIGDPATLELLTGMLQREKPLKLKTIEALRRLNVPEAVPALLPLLREQDAEVSGAAAEALGYLGDARAAESLLAAGQDAQSPIRAQAVAALGLLHEPRALPLLLSLLTSNEPVLRGNAIDALVRLADPRAVDGLLPLLDSHDPRTRIQAMQALGNMRDSRAVDALSTLVPAHSEEEQVRVYAEEALGKIRDARAEPALLSTLGGKVDAQSKPAVVALDVLAKLDSAEVTDVLISRAARDDGLRISALRALGASGSARAIPVLTDALDADNDQVRVAALLALAMIPDERAVQAVVTCIAGKLLPDMTDNAALMNALRRNPHVTAETLAALVKQRQNPDFICEVVAELGRIKVQDPRLLPALVRWISTTSFTLNDDLMTALRPYGAPLVDALRKAVAQPETTQPDMVVQVLGRMGDPRAIETLLPLLHEYEVDRGVVLEALARLKYTKSYPLLLAEERYSYVDSRCCAIAGLGALADPRAVPTLLGALREHATPMRVNTVPALMPQYDTTPLIHAAAAAALGQLGDPHATAGLLAALSDDVAAVRTAAARALAQLPPDASESAVLTRALFDMRSTDGADRQAVLAALLRLHDKDAGAAITIAVEREPKLHMAWLAEQHTPRAACLLIRLLHDEPDPAARAEAAATLAALKDPLATPHLIFALRDEAPEVRAAAQAALKTLTAQDFGADHPRWVTWWLAEQQIK